MVTISAAKVLHFIDICKFLGKKDGIFSPFNVFFALFTVIQYVKDHILSQAVHTEVRTDACQSHSFFKAARLMFTQIDPSVKIYVVAMSQPNYPLIIRRKGTTKK